MKVIFKLQKATAKFTKVTLDMWDEGSSGIARVCQHGYIIPFWILILQIFSIHALLCTIANATWFTPLRFDIKNSTDWTNDCHKFIDIVVSSLHLCETIHHWSKRSLRSSCGRVFWYKSGSQGSTSKSVYSSPSTLSKPSVEALALDSTLRRSLA